MENQNTTDPVRQWAPDYIGLGAMKSASSWLSACIREHPEVANDHRKEMHFFDLNSNYTQGIEHYKSQFSKRSDLLIGEITPSYFYEKPVASRIHASFPNVKLIVCLRNPADRAWSHYHYGIQMHGRLSVYSTFAEAFKSDRSLADNGRYGEQLQHYLKFFNKGQIKIVFYDELRRNPVEIVQDVYRFIGVSDHTYIPAAATKQVNKTGEIEVTLKYGQLWRFMLRIRSTLHKFPTLEALLKKHSLISRVKHIVRTENQNIHMTSEHKTSKKMTASDRMLVIDKLLSDIILLENITGKDLSSWKFF